MAADWVEEINSNTFLVHVLCLAGLVRDGALYRQEAVP